MSEQLNRREPLGPRETQLTPEQVLQAGSEFLDHFGVQQDPHIDPEQFIEAIGQLQPRHKGDRYLVRYELEQDQTEWPQETKGVIMSAAEGMRMLETETRLPYTPDAVIVLGGARQSNLDRIEYPLIAGLPKGRHADPAIVIVGSTRKLQDAEKENVANYAPGAETEYELCEAAALKYASIYKNGVQVLRSNDEKAGTPDVIDIAMRALVQSGMLKGSKYAKDLNGSVAAVTTQIYQASTQLDLSRVAARYNIVLAKTMGNPSDPNVVANRTPATYLSEVIRTLKAAANSINESGKVAEREDQESKLNEANRLYEEDPKNWETLSLSDDGGKTIRKPSGYEYVIEPKGGMWVSYSPVSGLRYSGPDDQIGFYDE